MARRGVPAGLVALTLLAAAPVCGQDAYPNQPVTVIMPFSAGGGVDLVARALSAELTRLLGQPFVVMTRDGAAGSVGFAALAQAKPDGYTLASSPATPITNVPHLQKGLPYTFASVVPICQTFENVFTIAVVPRSPYRTLQDLLDDARARPGQMFYGSVGLGSIPHLSVEALAQAAGVRVTLVPYRGDALLLPPLLSGEIAFAGIAISSIAGRDLRVLVVFGAERHPLYPDAPSSSELGNPAIPPGLNGLFAPAGTPEPVLQVLERACAEAVRAPAFTTQIERLNGRVAHLGRAAFTQRLRDDDAVKAALVRSLDLKAQ
ncbi:MAG: tripartite tricarboxylate transporter substrate binding protein [Alphaproteobacteria bacterium]|nr:tripartite tricarboxylate transporter substrate binding protein [Alphaproteobacteria bacterium]